MRVDRRVLCVLAGGLVALLGVGTEEADARPYRSAKAKHGVQKGEAAVARKEKAAPPPGPILAIVSLTKQRISVYGNSGLIAQNVVSSGRSGFPTPTGVFSIIQKNRHHRSNIYSGAPMPFMQRITWSGVALHAGVVPGYPASHGCIRLTHHFATELWGMTKLGARVVVTPEDVQAHEVAHAALPVPMMTPASVKVSESRGGEPMRGGLVTLAANSDTPAETSQPAPAGEKLLNPLERAQAAKIHTVADAAAKAKAMKEAIETSAARSAEANKAIAALRQAEMARAAAHSKLDAATKAVDGAKSPEAAERAKAVQATAQAKLEEAETAAAEAAATENTKTAEAFAAARAAKDAEIASGAATAAMKAAERGAEPISVFISKKAGRVYIRQAWVPIHEAAVTFKEPEAPLGTHLYLATEPLENGKAMRWLSVSLPPSAPDSKPHTRRGDKPAAAQTASPPRPRETAASVLARVEMAEETRRFIEDKVWTGASLIISDQGISHETGKYTDFIVLTR